MISLKKLGKSSDKSGKLSVDFNVKFVGFFILTFGFGVGLGRGVLILLGQGGQVPPTKKFCCGPLGNGLGYLGHLAFLTN